jgi:hypothetical protein
VKEGLSAIVVLVNHICEKDVGLDDRSAVKQERLCEPISNAVEQPAETRAA